MIAQQKKLLHGTEAICNGRGHRNNLSDLYSDLQGAFRRALRLPAFNWIADRQSSIRLWNLSEVLCRRGEP